MKKRGFSLETCTKKGQITIFIILGIVLLFAVITVVYITSQRQEAILEQGVIPALKTIPSEFEPIRVYVQDCMEKTAVSGFKRLGERGGYIYPDETGLISLSQFPTESDAVQFSPNSDLKVAYWYYLKAPNNCGVVGRCLFSSMRPPLYRKDGTDSVERQMDDYIKEQLPICLNNFASFREQGFEIEEVGEIIPETTIANQDVAVLLNYNLKISRGDVSGSVEDYFIRIPLNFKELYEFATEITNIEGKSNFLETHTMNLVSYFSGIDKEKLPPIGDVSMFDSAVTWSEIKTKDRIEDMLMVYVPFLQIYNSRNYIRRLTTGGTGGIYEHMEMPINLEGKYDDYSASFVYLKWWPIYLDINSRGDLVGPESLSNPLLPLNFIVHRYSTVYDISYPVIVEVSNPDALYGEGYTLRFALEANIRNDAAIDESFEGLEGVKIFEKSLFCNYNQRNSGNITIDVKDALSRDGLENAQIRFTCGSDSCIIGATDADGRFVGSFPICYNGIVSFVNPDYFASAQLLTTGLDKEKNVLAEAYPYINKKVRIKKYPYSSRFNQLALNPVGLDINERAIITMNREKDNVIEDDVSAFGEFKANDTTITLRLVPGRYSANINIFLEQRVYIPEEKRKIDVGFIGRLVGAEEEYTIPAVEFNESYPIGGAVYDAGSGLLTLKAEDLYKDNILELYIIGHEIPTKIEDLELVGGIQEQTTRFRSSLEPKYLK